MTNEESIKLLAGVFEGELLKTVCRYAIPIYWSTLKDDSWPTDTNATAFLLDCGKGPFVVTAAHVYEAYLQHRKEFNNICAQLEDLYFKLEERVICHLGSKKIDIATFRISKEEIKFLKSKNRVLICEPSQWPPPEVSQGEGVLFAGFPGHQRIEKEHNECSFGFYSAYTPVSSAGFRHFVCVFDRSQWIDAFGKGLPDEGYNIGGISGAPVFSLYKSKAEILSWSLAGVAYNATNNLGEVLLVHHAKFIKADGMLDIPI